MAAPRIGQKLSLISKSCIRYDGTLAGIDAAENTLTLSSVSMHGTEERPAAAFVPKSEQQYEFIVFRGNDIKDLTVYSDSTNMPPADPAIVSAGGAGGGAVAAASVPQVVAAAAGAPAYAAPQQAAAAVYGGYGQQGGAAPVGFGGMGGGMGGYGGYGGGGGGGGAVAAGGYGGYGGGAVGGGAATAGGAPRQPRQGKGGKGRRGQKGGRTGQEYAQAGGAKEKLKDFDFAEMNEKIDQMKGDGVQAEAQAAHKKGEISEPAK